VYLWIGRRPTAADNDDSESVVAGTANTRFIAAKISAMRTTLSYCSGMLPSSTLSFHIIWSSTWVHLNGDVGLEEGEY